MAATGGFFRAGFCFISRWRAYDWHPARFSLYLNNFCKNVARSSWMNNFRRLRSFICISARIFRNNQHFQFWRRTMLKIRNFSSNSQQKATGCWSVYGLVRLSFSTAAQPRTRLWTDSKAMPKRNQTRPIDHH